MKTTTSSFLKTCLLAALFTLALNIQTTAQITNNLELPTSINEDGAAPDSTAILDVQSSTKGLLVPRMTTAEREAIAGAATGLLVYNTDTGSYWYFDHDMWNEIASTIAVPAATGSNSTAIPIPGDDPIGIMSTINLTQPGVIEASTQIKACINVTHTWDDNLAISLIAPDNTTIDLSSDNWGIGDN